MIVAERHVSLSALIEQYLADPNPILIKQILAGRAPGENKQLKQEEVTERETYVLELIKLGLKVLASEGLRGSASGESERLKQEERALRKRVTAFRASDRLPRDDVHDRAR
ncbi:MAG: hypothetical protein ACREE4_00490 [Stellaceae bacterium]